MEGVGEVDLNHSGTYPYAKHYSIHQLFAIGNLFDLTPWPTTANFNWLTALIDVFRTQDLFIHVSY